MSAANGTCWRGEAVSRLVLGTVQLGLPYGIANRTGQPGPDEARALVSAAWEGGIGVFDTAQAYGQSETILGWAIKDLGIAGRAKIVTKLAPDIDPCDGRALLEAVEASCGRLGVERLWGLMLHHEQWLDRWDDGLGEVLRAVRRDGRVQYIGVSVYGTDYARAALDNADVDMIQAPCNAWDWRMVDQGLLALAAERDKLCFVRSIYLQGLLTLRPRQVWQKLPAAGPLADRWWALAQRCGTSPTNLAMRFVLSLGTPLVIGAETAAQVHDNLKTLHLEPLSAEETRRIRQELGPVEEAVYNPSLWDRSADGTGRGAPPVAARPQREGDE